VSAFLISTGIALILVGMGKLMLGFGEMNGLFVREPVLHLRFSHVIQVAGFVEVVIGFMCLLVCRTWPKKGLCVIAWLASCLACYRLGLWLMNWREPCNCMGYLIKTIHLSPRAADNTMKIFLIYMLTGSYAGLFWLWKRRADPQKLDTCLKSE